MPHASSPRMEYASESEKQQFHNPRTSHGATGHWIKTAGILAPLLIGEFVKDPDKRWRWVRISAVATALVSEAMWAGRIRKERSECAERR